MQFLSCSLEKLAAQLNADQFTHLRAAYPNPTQWSFSTKKGIYCYDYINSMERFDETSLPHKAHFFNKLAGEDIP